MKKIPTVLKRDPENMARVTSEVNPECQWVFDGEGIATRKFDGTCMMLDEDGQWWARREVKPGKTPPPGWVEADRDETTGKRPGWEPVEQSPFAKFHAEALGNPYERRPVGTYELIGPKINGNPEGWPTHGLIRHDDAPAITWEFNEPYGFDTLRQILTALGQQGREGIVWHHPDGRMAKLKARDFQ